MTEHENGRGNDECDRVPNEDFHSIAEEISQS
jgi:hypothetical protein